MVSSVDEQRSFVFMWRVFLAVQRTQRSCF